MQLLSLLGVALSCLWANASPSPASPTAESVLIRHDDPLIYHHGRWDASPGTWWAGTRFKLHVQGLSSLSLTLGPHTTSPNVPIGISVDYGPFTTVNVSEGVNHIPLGLGADEDDRLDARHVVRIDSWGWVDNRANLQSITLNRGAQLLPYTPSKLAFEFIGDSLSAGQYLPAGVEQAWTFLVGENFKAEHTVTAQPGIALADIKANENVHGMTFQFWKTEDGGYVYTTDHNYTTPYDFARDRPAATHVVIHIGANDPGNGDTAATFTPTYLGFIENLRKVYTHQPIFVFTPWGWPQPNGTVEYYLQGCYEDVVNTRHALGDHSVFLVNTTGWVTYADIFPDNSHPTVAGHQKIARLFEQWLQDWGLQPEAAWSTPI
ncbi:hypothetical protein DENSPDRAFT_842816 [Dentipellis sp. KUC8613]|nr:hypothetical protein DENSPDRAFT_842816 [Dentipellis sp. KUC8613]